MVFTCADSSQYVVLLQLVRQRSVEEVKKLMRPQLSLEAAKARVLKEVGHAGPQLP